MGSQARPGEDCHYHYQSRGGSARQSVGRELQRIDITNTIVDK